MMKQARESCSSMHISAQKGKEEACSSSSSGAGVTRSLARSLPIINLLSLPHSLSSLFLTLSSSLSLSHLSSSLSLPLTLLTHSPGRSPSLSLTLSHAPKQTSADGAQAALAAAAAAPAAALLLLRRSLLSLLLLLQLFSRARNLLKGDGFAYRG